LKDEGSSFLLAGSAKGVELATYIEKGKPLVTLVN